MLAPRRPSLFHRLALVALTLTPLVVRAADPTIATPPAASAPALAPVDLTSLDARTDSLLARTDLTAYRGWLKYLRHLAHDSAARQGAASESAHAAAARLDEWLGKIAADPAILGTLRGVQEWAYESPVDDSGQPFKLVIPDDYDPARPAALSLYLHGATGNHLDHSSGFHAHPGHFDMAVLGRSRIGGYTNLSEADVLQALAYVRAHWSIDPARLQLSGGSMGGMGTFRFGARYPHLWASGTVTCGAGDYLPAPNLLTLPLYVLHSIDDPVVPVLESRAVVQQLLALGGQVIRDETNGLGHAAWDYKDGQARASVWAMRQTRRDSRSIRQIDYTAYDSVAARGWWAEITEWGDAPTPARLVATVGGDNTLHLVFTNLKAATLRLRESPLDLAQPLHLVIDAAVPLTVPAPLPDELTVSRSAAGAWTFAASRPIEPIRLHAPGGPSLLYNGEPLLIVYGTAGDDAHRAALKAAALNAARSPSPIWQEPVTSDGANDAAGIPQTENLYGSLRVTADIDVTDDDLARCHLVLIGTAEENRLVARLAPQLPVALTADAVVCNDGQRIAGDHLALGLVHYNPLAPQRLIFWVAGHDLAAYAPGAAVPMVMVSRLNQIWGLHFGADLLVSRTGPQAADIVSTRAFGSRWQWINTRAPSPLVPERACTYAGFYQSLAESIQRVARTDFALAEITDRPMPRALSGFKPRHAAFAAAGITRLVDLQADYPTQRIGIFEITGADLRAALAQVDDGKTPYALAGDLASLDPARTYTLALATETIWWWNSQTKFVPAEYRQTELTVAAAIAELR